MKKRIEIIREFSSQVEKLFAYLEKHENLENIFKPARVTRMRNGERTGNGAGTKSAEAVLRDLTQF